MPAEEEVVAARVRSPFLQFAIGYARTLGVQLRVPTGELSVPTFIRHTNAIALACRDEHVGVAIARFIPRGTYQLVEYAARSTETVLDSLRVASAYAPLMNDRLRMRVVESGDELRVEHWIEGEPASLGRHFDEFAMATAARFVEEITGEVKLLRVHFVHARDPKCSPTAHFAAPIRHAQDRNAIVLRRADGAKRLRNADEPLAKMLCRLSADALEGTGPIDIVTRTRSAIARVLDVADADIATIARALALSVRTLERRLEDEGTTFDAVRDAYRRDLAGHLVARSDVTPEEAARRLRFRSLRGYQRALARWAQRPQSDRTACR